MRICLVLPETMEKILAEAAAAAAKPVEGMFSLPPLPETPVVEVTPKD